MITQINIVKEPEYYYPAGLAEKNGLMTYQEFQKLDSIPTPSNIVTKSSTAGLLKNDGTVDTNSYAKKSDIEEIKTATGNPITLTDAVAGNALEASAEIVATQDLHGYDHPWAGGAGKNKAPLKSKTGSGLTFIADESLGKMTLTGTATASGWGTGIITEIYLPAGSYICSASNNPDNANIMTEWQPLGAITSSGITFNVASNTQPVRVAWVLASGTTYNSVIEGLMIRSASESDPTFEPYSNICPITGFSSVTITDTDSESQTATVTVSLGSTVYGGTLDLTSGELTISHGEVDLGSLSWVYDSGDRRFNAVLSGIKDVTFRTLPMKCSCYDVIDDGTPFAQLPPYCIYNNGTSISVHDARYTDAALFTTAVTGQTLVYPLEDPTTTTLTAAQLALVKGYNQLSCNSGDMEITYKASGLDALKERVDELEDAVEDLETDLASKTDTSVVGTVENGTTASRAYAVGEHFIRNDKFCTAIASIASGATLTLNTNYVEGTIAEAITKRVNYSTTEHVIGTWIDGSTVYEKTVDVGAMPAATTKRVDAGLPSGSTVIEVFGFTTESTCTTTFPLPFADATTSYNYNFQLAYGNGYIELKTSANQAHMVNGYVTLRYIKSSL